MAGPPAALRYADGVLWALDQTQLPWRETELELRRAADVIAALQRLSIRGAPLIGVAAGYGVALELMADPHALDDACAQLIAARPTAVNLAHAVRRVAGAARRDGGPGGSADAAAALAEAQALHAEEERASTAMARHGAAFLAGARRILTHCNTGALAAPGRGTALGVISELAATAGVELVLATETRPLLQGARLTVYELARLGIPHALIVDGAAAGLIAAGEVDAVIVGADRIAANGDTANKVGTYAHALAAAAAGIPFAVAAPCTTIDPDCADGSAITIERRAGDEVRSVGLWGEQPLELAPAGTPCLNPAFDVTPASLITAIITDRGVAAPVSADALRTLLTTPGGEPGSPRSGESR